MALKVASCIRFARPRLLWSMLTYHPCSDAPAARACEAAGSSAAFESAIRSLKNNLQPERLTRVLDSTSDLNLALRIFKWASSQRIFVHTADTYACMISKLGAVGNCDEMDILLKEMIKLNVPVLDKILNDLVQYLISKNRYDEALLVVQNACSGKLKLSVSSCNVVLCGLAKEGRGLRPFVRAYMEIVKAGVLPDADTLNWLIEALCGAGRLDLALIQFDRMSKKRCTPNSHTFKILITALCSHGRADESVELFEKMLQLRCIPDISFYFQVLPVFCKFNKPKEASKLHQMMKQNGLQLDLHLYSALIRCLCENRLLDAAVTTFKEMTASGHTPMANTYVNVVDCYCTFAQFHKAVSFLEENDVAETEPYNVLLRAFGKAARLRDSVSYLEEFQKRGLVDCQSWNTVITQFCNEGNIRRASELIGRMVLSSFTADESTYSSVVSCYCRLGLYKNALDMFRKVSVGNLLLNSESFSQLVECLCHTKRIQEAAEVFKYHCKRGCSLRSKSLDMLIQGSCMAGMIREAIRMRSLAVCTGTSCTFSTYNTIIQALFQLKKEKDALLILAQMLMEGCVLDSYAYNVLLRCFLTKETVLEAAILFNRMVNDGFVPDQETFELLVPDMAVFSLLSTVSESLLKVVNIDGVMSPRISNIIIYGLIKEGFKNEACKFLDQMLDKGWVPDSKTHSVLVGTVDGKEATEVNNVYQKTDDDIVSNILLEGLE
ncbi:pentatricopeptide repeat-containing protein At1g63080, mitochondrial [Brachypodium distachyon]|uniref:Pentacotripeptide-repeat region of PRORP domain-containing protein n=1 Tax=Brachypodium distachyon TaxID=15368 RepID=I1GM89_BRADI|nr:pentatricopeptide repeat-containing protein At1g63080, mitochondrial [Brachypodium distachyon]XP_010228449.1 pentatricopeptide repeat-containing protein At1g63080, mitochondrial [Brachypodium distachyon]XP_010228455.1 pentatricopeptide repeat-containing protein At1g63080, mitochondrial [Brachypodium distachyon]XP_010228457.1 pentatricopeptide repeat-containing protein At1g63080, mitochondrial [Brachypodium distachyon]XP_024313470.1 pentatricopeptide repeat-containing protein At1g63080, mitoc|eukprot:XP_010228446.1 pentatricopeptide repeat-containing protein At1g63080, mitochondrial [Brachypodium distachyon]